MSGDRQVDRLDSCQVVILAGGLGTRLGSLTEKIPKPLMLVKDVPFLEWQILFFRNHGFKRFLFLTGYKGELIEAYFKNGENLGVKIAYSREEVPLGTGGALLQAASQLDEVFLLAFGDSLLPMDGHLILEKLKNLGDSCEGVMCVYDNRENTDVPFNVSLEKDFIAKYFKGTAGVVRPHDLTFVEAGVYCMRKRIFEGQELRPCSFESDLLAPLIGKRLIGALLCSQRFFDIGTPDRLKLFEDRISDYFPNSIQT